MNTNDQQFLKAYNDLVTAFFNFMNVVSPNNNSQPNLSYVASQLNQVLNYLGTLSQGGGQSLVRPLFPFRRLSRPLILFQPRILYLLLIPPLIQSPI